MQQRILKFAGVMTIAAAIAATPAFASLSSVSAGVTGSEATVFAPPSGVTFLTLTSPTGTVPYNGATPLTPQAGLSIDVSKATAGNGLVQGNGSPPNNYVAPYQNATTTVSGNYLAPGLGSGSITYNFSPATTPIRSFGILWGSVDDFNRLIITSTIGTYVVSGPDLLNSSGAVSPDNSFYVTFNTNPGVFFQTIVADDGAPTGRNPAYTFEQLPIFISGTPVGVPEPISLALLGSGIAGLALLRRRA